MRSLLSLHYISVVLLEIHMVVVVEVALLQHPPDEFFILMVLLLVGLEDDLELAFADPPIMVQIEVVEGELEVLSVVGCRFGQTGRDELVVGQAAVVIDVHGLDDVFDLVVGGLLVVLSEVVAQLFDGEVPVFVFVDFEEDFPQNCDLLLGELGGDIVQHQYFELSGPMLTCLSEDVPWKKWSSF